MTTVGNIIAPWATLIYLSDEKVVKGFCYWLLLMRKWIVSRQAFSLLPSHYVGLQACNPYKSLTKSLKKRKSNFFNDLSVLHLLGYFNFVFCYG